MNKKLLIPAYYAAAAALILLVSVFSAVTLNDRGDKYKASADFDTEKIYAHIGKFAAAPRPRLSAAHEDVRQYILDELNSYGARPVEMNYIARYSDYKEGMTGYGGESTLVPDGYVKNILVEIEGETDDVMLVMAHYDGVPMGFGAYDDAISASVMLETVRQLKLSGKRYRNKIAFLFADGEEEALYGSKMFADKYPTANAVDERYINLADKVKFVTNWEARGTGGTLLMFETTKGNYDTIKNFAKFNGLYTNSTANFVYAQMPNGTDYSSFSAKGIQGLNFANIGEGQNYHTQNDRVENIDKSNIALMARTVKSTLDYFGAFDLNTLYNASGNATFFSWLNLFTVYYSALFAAILAALTVVAFAIAAWFNYKNKKYDFKTFGKAFGVSWLVLIGSVIAGFAGYSVLKLIFGLRLSSSSYALSVVEFGAFFLLLAAYMFLSALFNKIFKIDKPEYNVYGNGAVIALLGVILSFAVPELSYIFAPAGFLVSVVILLDIAVKKTDLSRYALIFVPLIFILPLTLPLLILATQALGNGMAVFAAVPAVMSLGLITPYVSNLKKKLTAFTAARPEENKSGISNLIGKAAPRTHGILSALSLVLALILLAAGGFASVNLSTNLSGKASGRTLMFIDDTIIYNAVLDTNGLPRREEYLIYDKDANNYLTGKYNLKTAYDKETGAYKFDGGIYIDLPQPKVQTAKGSDVNGTYFKITLGKNFPDSVLTFYLPRGAATRIEADDPAKEDDDETRTSVFTDFSQMSGEIKFRTGNDTVLRIYTTLGSLLFEVVENASFDLSKSPVIAEIKAKEPYLKTGVQIRKLYNIS